MGIRLTESKLLIINISGALYTALTIVGIAVLNLYCTCPDLYGDCFWPVVNASIILLEIFVNLLLFHYYNKRNQVQFWTAKSSSLLSLDLELKAGQALNGQFMDGIESIRTENKLTHISTQNHNHTTGTKYDIKNFTKYAICEDGTYVDLKNEIWGPSHSQQTNNNSPNKYCHECKKVVPHRCHHCPLCKICVLRRDHHCFLLGGCAGLANQRYFIVFLFWATIGAAYGSSFNLAYLNRYVKPWFPFGWLCYLGPIAMIRWVIGMETAYNMFLAIMFTVSFASTLGAFGFFVFQMIYTLSGYTMYDYHRSGSKCSESDGDNCSERLALVFGRRWWLNFVFPQFWNPNQMNEKIARNVFLSISKDL